MKRNLYAKYEFDGLERTIDKNQYSAKSLNPTPVKLQPPMRILRNRKSNYSSVIEKIPLKSVSKKVNYNTLTIQDPN